MANRWLLQFLRLHVRGEGDENKAEEQPQLSAVLAIVLSHPVARTHSLQARWAAQPEKEDRTVAPRPRKDERVGALV